MPAGEGWWLHPTGRSVAIFEHLNAVTTNPRAFGLTQDNMVKRPREPEEDYRRRVLTEVLRKGWIRVRSYQGFTVFEYWKLSRRVADAVCEFISDTLGGGIGSQYQMNEVSTDRSFYVGGRCFDDMDAQLGGAVTDKHARKAQLYMLGCNCGQGS